jgi:signal transduction histidine kinase
MTDTAPERILVVEDNPADARLIEEYLTERSWPDIAGENPTIEYVDRLEDAVGAVEDAPAGFDIVLLDLGLPDSNGLNTLDGMLGVGERVPVVVLTGLEDERVGVEAVEHGAQEYLVKNDLTPRLLRQTLRNAIQRARQQEELRQRNAELAILNQVVRHDIRNDVAVILSWGETLDTHVDETGESYLDRIMHAGDHITEITETVGNFLRVLEDGNDPDLQAVDLTAVLRNEVEKARSAHDEAAITVTEEYEGTLRVAATELLSSVFRNIIKNAVVHNDKPEPEITVRVDADDEVCSVRIADNGPGVRDSQKAEIFGRGEMGLESSGSGIGLYLVDTLVDMYGGSVELTDNEPEGSVFTVELQRYDP